VASWRQCAQLLQELDVFISPAPRMLCNCQRVFVCLLTGLRKELKPRRVVGFWRETIEF